MPAKKRAPDDPSGELAFPFTSPSFDSNGDLALRPPSSSFVLFAARAWSCSHLVEVIMEVSLLSFLLGEREVGRTIESLKLTSTASSLPLAPIPSLSFFPKLTLPADYLQLSGPEPSSPLTLDSFGGRC